MLDALLHEKLGVCVDAARRLVQNEDAGIGNHRAGKGKQLLLPDGKPAAAFGQLGVVAFSSFMIKSWALTAFAAATISSSVALSLP